MKGLTFFQKLLISIGLGGAVISSILGFLAFPQLLQIGIPKMKALKQGTAIFETWRVTPVPLYLRIHVFNVTNPVEIQQEGAIPIVKEMGPYTYLEKRVKVDLMENDDEDTISYRQVLTLWFQPNLSSGSEDDLVTFANVPLIGVAKKSHDLTDVDYIHSKLDERLVENGGLTLFTTATIRDFLWDGFSIQPILDLLQDPLVQSLRNEPVEIPETFKDGKFALMEGKNGSDDGVFVVSKGNLDWRSLGQIRSWNNYTSLPWWNDTCAELKGGDGNSGLFPPFFNPDLTLWTFGPLLCRPLSLEYQNEVEYEGMKVVSLGAAKHHFLGVKSYEPNSCFCTDPQELCEKDGLIRTSGCTGGAPISFSQPHFLNADPEFRENVLGLSPDPTKHETEVYMEPTMGVAVKASKRMQLNVDLVPYEAMPTFSDLRNATTTLPVMWLEEAPVMTEKILGKLRTVQNLKSGIESGRFVIIPAFLFIAAVGAGLSVLKLTKAKDVKQME